MILCIEIITHQCDCEHTVYIDYKGKVYCKQKQVNMRSVTWCVIK